MATELLKLAIDARVPVVAITTTDTVNVKEIVADLAGTSALDYGGPATQLKPNALYLVVGAKKTKDFDFEKIHAKLEEAGSTLLVVNPGRHDDSFFQAGELPLPKKMIFEYLMQQVETKEAAEELQAALGGCTFKDVGDYVRLTTARDKSITPLGLMKTRKEFFSSLKGLTQVDTEVDFYDPPADLLEWCQNEKHFFLHSTDPRLTPRGLLMDGPPGTGKTMGSKYIAGYFGVPLFRLDIGGVKNKYVGESENNLLQALAKVDYEEPCIVLIDEVEKVFGEQGETGTSTSMLSQLLWWLAEHKSRVLTIMTTNKKADLPKELYREGRLDEVLRFEGLDTDNQIPFVKSVWNTFSELADYEVSDENLNDVLSIAQGLLPEDHQDTGYIPQALLVEAVKKSIKFILRANYDIDGTPDK